MPMRDDEHEPEKELVARNEGSGPFVVPLARLVSLRRGVGHVLRQFGTCLNRRLYLT